MDKINIAEKDFLGVPFSQVIEGVKKGVDVAHLAVYQSALSNEDSITIQVSLDKKEDWSNGIFQNSRYGAFLVDDRGVLELAAQSYKLPVKLRKSRVKSTKDIVNKINKWVKDNS